MMSRIRYQINKWENIKCQEEKKQITEYSAYTVNYLSLSCPDSCVTYQGDHHR